MGILGGGNFDASFCCFRVCDETFAIERSVQRCYTLLDPYLLANCWYLFHPGFTPDESRKALTTMEDGSEQQGTGYYWFTLI